MKNKCCLVLSVAGVLSLSNAFAESSSNSLNISTQAVASCTMSINGSGRLDGVDTNGIIQNNDLIIDYNPSKFTRVFLTVDYACSNGIPINFNLGSANGTGGIYSLISDKGNTLMYQLNFTNGSTYLVAVGSGSMKSANFRVVVPSGQYVEPGAYYDTVHLNLTY